MLKRPPLSIKTKYSFGKKNLNLILNFKFEFKISFFMDKGGHFDHLGFLIGPDQV